MLTLSSLYITVILTSVFIYYAVNKRFKPAVLFTASIIFITVLSFKALIFAVILTTMNYFSGILLEKCKERRILRSVLFWSNILINIGTLVLCKTLSHCINGFFPALSFNLTDTAAAYDYLIIPLGISYYSFQSIGYIIRINRGAEKAEPDFIKFGTYLLFFPKFLSGPVIRSNHFFPQINQPAGFEAENIHQGVRLLLWGLFKKIVIADTLGLPVMLVYNNMTTYSGAPLIFVLLIQVLYIYFDFSGYTDMAMGIARLFGITVMDNFNRPFFARSVTDYWRRWHISLSSWCNDFIYYPFIIKFRKFENFAITAGIFLTFFVVGIWHGFNLTFVILGILQGIAIIYEYYTKKYRFRIASGFSKGLVAVTSRVLVYLFISLSLVFFFSRNVPDASYFLSHLFSWQQGVLIPHELIAEKSRLIIAFSCIIFLLYLESLNEKGQDVLAKYLRQPVWIQWLGYLVCIGLILLLYSGIASFYYMRF